jgi:pimeloyl-ACP methyl ester carboxylesterase
VKRTARILAGILLALAVALGGLVAYHWAPDRPVSALAARWAPPPSQFVAIGGLQVHLRDEGPRDDPTPIVLLHGTSASLHTWDGWVEVLRPRHRVVRLDLPGFGLTGPALHDDYSMARYVEFVAAALDTLGIEQCVIAGNSLGGWISWETALAHPDRIKGLVLVDAAGYPLQSESVPIGFRLANMPALNRVMRSALPRGVVESSLRNTYGDPSRVTPELVDRYYELTLREGNRGALAKRFAAGRGTTAPERIRSLRVPTLIIWGDRDRLVPPLHAERFHRDVAGSELVMFPGLGHVPQEEDPAATAAALLAFLDRAALTAPE